MKMVPFLLSLCLVLLLSSCAHNQGARQNSVQGTRGAHQMRIKKNPQVFNKLSTADRKLVQEGRIREGMSKDGVFLAWGKPAVKREQSANGKRQEIWSYRGSEAVPVRNYNFGYGFGGYSSRYYHGYNRGPSFGMGTDIAFVPYERARVVFVNGRVKSYFRQR
ncbi:MAG: hypothetical protein AAF226_05135 [Verrucomicrobiota bacterium]